MAVHNLVGKWFIDFDPKNPSDFQVFFTEDGTPGGTRKFFRMFLHPGPPYPQPLIEEVDFKEDGTVGAIEPLVCLTKANAFVAVKRNPRHMGEVVEAWRKSWGNPAEAPALTSNGGTIKTYTDADLGRGYANTARILGQIGYRLTVVSANTPPSLSEGEWMGLKEFMRDSYDQMGKAVIGVALALRYIT